MADRLTPSRVMRIGGQFEDLLIRASQSGNNKSCKARLAGWELVCLLYFCSSVSPPSPQKQLPTNNHVHFIFVQI